MAKEKKPLEREGLNSRSQQLLEMLEVHLANRTTIRSMERAEDGTWDLLIVVPSPIADGKRDIAFWFDEIGTPSMEFGAWHMHATGWNPGETNCAESLREILTHLRAILADRYVLLDRRIPGRPLTDTVDLDDPDDLMDWITHPALPPAIDLLSWGGTTDRTVSIADAQALKRGPV
jgi:hypothetical protein